MEAEIYFREVQAKIDRRARLDAISRTACWSIEIARHLNKWKDYSPKLNGIIEDAFSKKATSVSRRILMSVHSHSFDPPFQVDFDDEQGNACQIDFSAMQCRRAGLIHIVRRTLPEVSLPHVSQLLIESFETRLTFE